MHRRSGRPSGAEAGALLVDGMNVGGRVVTTVLRGEVAYDGKDVIARPGPRPADPSRSGPKGRSPMTVGRMGQ